VADEGGKNKRFGVLSIVNPSWLRKVSGGADGYCYERLANDNGKILDATGKEKMTWQVGAKWK